ncbi:MULTISPECIES: class I SAM-dependent methyltransferase [Polymorphospora]|uniref:Class I SAM-dependent methyltransferase n=1 Tax=Polymorphospora lycopeni TaxID=3140240 RepID=A0ABV5CTB4_9ACTN
MSTNPTDSSTMDFEAFYQGESPVEGMTFAAVPWDIGAVQPVVVDCERAGRISGSVLDAGCGLGDNAIHLAKLGYQVVAVDVAPTAVEWARKRADAAGADAVFEVADATSLAAYEGRFDTLLDSALYDVLDAEQRRAYAAALHRAGRPGSRLNLFCFADTMPFDLPGVYRISADELHGTLGGAGWRITDLRIGTYLVNTVAGEFFSRAGIPVDKDELGRPKLPAWICEAERD